MSSLSFFLGLAFDDELKGHIERASSFERTLFISGGNYLKEIEVNGSLFLGKELLPLMTMEEVEALSAHIKSLFFRLVPNYPLTNESLSLIAYESRGDHHHEGGGRKTTRRASRCPLS